MTADSAMAYALETLSGSAISNRRHLESAVAQSTLTSHAPKICSTDEATEIRLASRTSDEDDEWG